jgi:transcription elongation regulator 1
MEYAHMNLGMGGHAPFQQFGGALPPGWLEYRTPTGQPYWYNTFTRQSSWQFPAVVVPQPQPQKKKQIK